MSAENILILLLIAGIVGSIGAGLIRARGYGCIMHIVIGFIGAFLGSWAAQKFGLPEPLKVSVGGHEILLLWSIIGSVVVVAILSLFSRRYYGS
jgi:uncharacterized membrane protein YeaQ/YmgE (transglycosylase-associated protein family)